MYGKEDQKAMEGPGENGRGAKDRKIWRDWGEYLVRQNTTSGIDDCCKIKNLKIFFSKLRVLTVYT